MARKQPEAAAPEKAVPLARKKPGPPRRKVSENDLNGQPGMQPFIDRAIEVIGDRDTALRWLGTPVRALDYATPISCLHNPKGQSDVLRVLTQLEHGVL